MMNILNFLVVSGWFSGSPDGSWRVLKDHDQCSPHHESFKNHLRLRRDGINHLYQLKFLTDGLIASACMSMLMGTWMLYKYWAGISSLWLLCSAISAFRGSRIYIPSSLSPSILVTHLCKYVTRLEYPTSGEVWVAQRTSALYIGSTRCWIKTLQLVYVKFIINWVLQSSVCFLQPNLVLVTPHFCSWSL